MAHKEATEKAGEAFFRRLAGYIWTGLSPSTELIVEAFKKSGEKHMLYTPGQLWEQWCDRLAQDKKIDQDTANLIKTVVHDNFPWNAIEMVLLRVQVITTTVKAIMDIYSLDLQYDHLVKTTPNPAPADNLIRAMIIDPERTTANRQELKKYGYSDVQIDNMILSYYRTTDEDTLRIAYLRGIIDEKTLYERMHELGYTDTRIKEIIPTWQLLPGPQDLFTMVAHEAFEPDMYTKLGLEEEFPEDQVEWLKKQGISEAWARKYWISHWIEPSIGQGYEMLHRGQIDLEGLDMLYRTVEIPRYWRDKLTAIAYEPYTRVDVRRMHAIGVLSDAELQRAYMDLGFDSEKALKMAQFTVKYNSEHEKELTRSAILSSYENGLISRKDAKDLLVAQDYSDPLAEFYLTISDYNSDQDTQQLLFENIRERYLLKGISETEVKTKLSEMNIQGEKINALLEKWQLQTYKYERLPSLSDLTDFLLRGIINEDQYRQIMSRHGYSPAHIQWYIQALHQPPAETPRFPSRTDLEHFLKKKIISEDQYRIEMKKHGYENKYIEWYLKEMK